MPIKRIRFGNWSTYPDCVYCCIGDIVGLEAYDVKQKHIEPDGDNYMLCSEGGGLSEVDMEQVLSNMSGFRYK